jgi:hypothetical protein
MKLKWPLPGCSQQGDNKHAYAYCYAESRGRDDSPRHGGRSYDIRAKPIGGEQSRGIHIPFINIAENRFLIDLVSDSSSDHSENVLL